MPRDVLVISAHIGDVILGCGGTVSQHARAGDRVRVLVLGEGLTSRARTLEAGQQALDISALEQQGRQALDLLGVRDVMFHSLPDNRFDQVPMLEIVKLIEDAKRFSLPDLVYTNTEGDLGIDQRIVARAVATAFRPQPGDNRTALVAFEVRSSTEWDFSGRGRQFVPNVFVDIAASLETKLTAFHALKLEQRGEGHARSPAAVREHARYRGMTAGMHAAEAFELLRAVAAIDHGSRP
jgi:LmbE family N-acetylglucosaminyl deacetylase